MAEGGIISNVYGANSCPNFAYYSRVYETYMPVAFHLKWVPANVLSKVESPTSLQNTSYMGPIEVIDDPDSFDCTGYN
jgi:hypothetical protein